MQFVLVSQCLTNQFCIFEIVALSTPILISTLRLLWPNYSLWSSNATTLYTNNVSLQFVSLCFMYSFRISKFFISPICHAKINIPLVVAKFDILHVHSLIHHIPSINKHKKHPPPSCGQPIPPQFLSNK